MDDSSTSKMVEYLPDDLVWVKAAAGMWWPAVVQDQETLDPEVTAGLKKTPLVVVKFLEENYYWTLNSLDPICPYNGERKIEHLEKGFKKYEALKHEKSMTMFPTAVEAAEKLSGGNPSIVEEYMTKFKTPDPPARVPKRKRSTLPKQPNLYNRTPKKEIIPRFHHMVSLYPSPPVEPGTDGVDTYPCSYCHDLFPSIGAFISHNKYSYRIGHLNNGGVFVRPKPFGSTLKKKKKAKVLKPAGNQTKRKSSEKPKIQKKMKVDQDESKKLEVSVEAASILDDWDDEEAEDVGNEDPTQEPAAASTPAPASQRHKTEEPPSDNSLANLSTVCVKGSPTVADENHTTHNSTLKTNDSSTSRSAFDFEDDEPQNSLTTFRFGQKLPRLRIPDKSKDRSGDSLLDGDLDRLLEETSVPALPEIPSAGLVRRNLDDSCVTSLNSSPSKDSMKSPITNEELFLAEGPLQSRDQKSLQIEGAEGGSTDNCSTNEKEPSISSKKALIESCPGTLHRSKRKSLATAHDFDCNTIDSVNQSLPIESQNSDCKSSDIVDVVQSKKSEPVIGSERVSNTDTKPDLLDSSLVGLKNSSETFLTDRPDLALPCVLLDDPKVKPEDPELKKTSPKPVDIPLLSKSAEKDMDDSLMILPAKKRKLDKQTEEDTSNTSQETAIVLREHELSEKPFDGLAPEVDNSLGESTKGVQPAELPSAMDEVASKKELRASKMRSDAAKEKSPIVKPDVDLSGHKTDKVKGKRDKSSRASFMMVQKECNSADRINAKLETENSDVQTPKSKTRKSEVSAKNEGATRLRRVSRRSSIELFPNDLKEAKESSSDKQNTISKKDSSKKGEVKSQKSKSKSPAKRASRHRDISPLNKSSIKHDKTPSVDIETPIRNRMTRESTRNKEQKEGQASSSSKSPCREGESQVDKGRRVSKSGLIHPMNENMENPVDQARKSSRNRLGKGRDKEPAKSFDDVLLEAQSVFVASPKTSGKKNKYAVVSNADAAVGKKLKLSKSKEAVGRHKELTKSKAVSQEPKDSSGTIPAKISKTDKSLLPGQMKKSHVELTPDSPKIKEVKQMSEDFKLASTESPKRKKSSIPPSSLETPSKNSEPPVGKKGKSPIANKSCEVSKTDSDITLDSSEGRDVKKSPISTETLDLSPKVKTPSTDLKTQSGKTETLNDNQTRSVKQDHAHKKKAKPLPETDDGSPKSKDAKHRDKFSMALQDADLVMTGKRINSSRHSSPSKLSSFRDADDYKGKSKGLSQLSPEKKRSDSISEPVKSKDSPKKLSKALLTPEKLLVSPSSPKLLNELPIDEKSPSRSSNKKLKSGKVSDLAKDQGENELKDLELKEPKTPSKPANEPSSPNKKRYVDKTKRSSNEDEVKHLLDVLSGKDDSSGSTDLKPDQLHPETISLTPKTSDETSGNLKHAASEQQKVSEDSATYTVIKKDDASGVNDAINDGEDAQPEEITAAVSPKKIQPMKKDSLLSNQKGNAGVDDSMEKDCSTLEPDVGSRGKTDIPSHIQAVLPHSEVIRPVDEENPGLAAYQSLSPRKNKPAESKEESSTVQECTERSKLNSQDLAVMEENSRVEKGSCLWELSDLSQPKDEQKDSSKLPSTESTGGSGDATLSSDIQVLASELETSSGPESLTNDKSLSNEQNHNKLHTKPEQFVDKTKPHDVSATEPDVKVQLENAEVDKKRASLEPVQTAPLADNTTKIIESTSVKLKEPQTLSHKILSMTGLKKTEVFSSPPVRMMANDTEPINKPQHTLSSKMLVASTVNSFTNATKFQPLDGFKAVCESPTKQSSIAETNTKDTIRMDIPNSKQDEQLADVSSISPKKVESGLSFTIKSTPLVKHSRHFPLEKLSNSKPQAISKIKSVESDRKLSASLTIPKTTPEKNDPSKVKDIVNSTKLPAASEVATSLSPVRASRWDVRTPASSSSPTKQPTTPNQQSGARSKLDFNVTGVRYDSSKSGTTLLGKNLPSTPLKAANSPIDQNNGDLSESDDLSAMEADILSYLKGDSVEKKAQPGKTPEKSKIVGLSEAQALAKLLQSDDLPAINTDAPSITKIEPPNVDSSNCTRTSEEESSSGDVSKASIIGVHTPLLTVRSADSSVLAKEVSRTDSSSSSSSIAQLASDSPIGDQNLRLGGLDFDINSIPIVFEGMFDSEPTIDPATQAPSTQPECARKDGSTSAKTDQSSGTSTGSTSTSHPAPPEPAKHAVRRIVKRTTLMVMPFFCKSGLPDPKKIARVEAELLKVVPNSKPLVTYADWLASPVTAPIRQAMAKTDSTVQASPIPRCLKPLVGAPVKEKPAGQQTAVIRIEPKKVALATTRTFSKLDSKPTKVIPVQRTEMVANFPKIVAASSLPNQIVGTRVQNVRTVKSPNAMPTAIRSGKITVSPKPAGAVNYIVVPSRGPRFVACTTSQKVVRTKSTESPTTPAASSSRSTDILAQAMAGTDIPPADVSSFSLDVA